MTQEEITTAVKALKRKKAPGIDGVPAEIIKLCHRHRPGLINDVISTCLKEGTFPTNWKTSKLILIPKPKKHDNEPTKYRPISLINATAKVLEHVINNRIIRYLDETGGLNDRQYGFRKNRSTINAIDKVVDEITAGINSQG